MDLFIERPTIDDENGFIAMMNDWEQSGERIVPGIIKNYSPDFSSFLRLLDNCHYGIGLRDTQVPNTVYILKNNRGKILGAISIRHYLTEDLQTMVDI